MVDQGWDWIGLVDGRAYAADFKWFYADPDAILPVLDLLCDLADAAEGASANSKRPPSPT